MLKLSKQTYEHLVLHTFKEKTIVDSNKFISRVVTLGIENIKFAQHFHN